ncbi:MAG: hypothetical protein WCA35_10220 [Kovacikia sp.]
MPYITEHDYNIRSETIQGEIRFTKIQGLLEDLRAERGKTEQKRVTADIQWQKVETKRVHLQIAREETATAQYQLLGAQRNTQIAGIEAEKVGDRLLYTGLERQAERQLLGQKLYTLDLNIGEAIQLNAHKRTELTQKLGNMPATNYRGALSGRL